jgi:hypothetical protein
VDIEALSLFDALTAREWMSRNFLSLGANAHVITQSTNGLLDKRHRD